jgi:hypothetical protein
MYARTYNVSDMRYWLDIVGLVESTRKLAATGF